MIYKNIHEKEKNRNLITRVSKIYKQLREKKFTPKRKWSARYMILVNYQDKNQWAAGLEVWHGKPLSSKDTL